MHPHRAGLAAIVISCVLWGGSFYFGKLALTEMTPLEVVFWRFAFAIAVLAPLLGAGILRRSPVPAGVGAVPLYRTPRRAHLPVFLLNALLMVPAQFVLQFEGLARTSASSASLLVGFFAPLMAIGGVVIARERLHLPGWSAIALSTLGVGIMVGNPGAGRTLTGDLMVVASLGCAVCMVLVTQRLIRRYEALTVTVWSMGIGTVMLLPWILVVHGWPSLPVGAAAWAGILALGFGCTAATFSLWNWGLRYVPASHAGVFVNLEPFIGAVLGVTLLGDTLTGALVIGGLLILSAALIISWPRPQPAVAPLGV